MCRRRGAAQDAAARRPGPHRTARVLGGVLVCCAHLQLGSALAFAPGAGIAVRNAQRYNWYNAGTCPGRGAARTSRARRCTTMMVQDPTLTFNFLAGGLAGMCASAAAQPFYVAKTKQQQRTCAGGAGGEDQDADGIGSGGTLDTMAQIVRRDGLKGLWVGLAPVLLFAFPESALQLSTHDWAVGALGGDGGGSGLPVLLQALAAGLAAVPSVVATNPMEMLAIRASDDASSSEIESNVLHNIEALGVDRLYEGFATTWLRDVPFLGLYFPLFASLSAALSDCLAGACSAPELAAALDSLAVVVAGTAAGMVASAVTTPMDVINVAVKTRLLRSAGDASPGLRLTTAFARRGHPRHGACAGSGGSQLQLASDAVRQVYGREGVAGFFSGMSARVSSVVPAQALTVCLYTLIHWLFSA